MEEFTFKFYDDVPAQAYFCGMDVHKHEIAASMCSARSHASNIVNTTFFSADADGLEQFWNYAKKYSPRAFAMEATGVYHHVPYEFLENMRSKADWNYKIVVVNPSDAKGLPGRAKNDKIDAEYLAIYLSKGLLKTGKPVVKVVEDLKSIFRMAYWLERDRTALKNRIKKTLDRAGIRPKRFHLDTLWGTLLLYHFVDFNGTLGDFLDSTTNPEHPLQKHRRIIAKNLPLFQPYFNVSLSSAQRSLIRHYLVELDFKTSSKTLLGVEVEQILDDLPSIKRAAANLASIPGFSPPTAVWILAEITNFNQFKNRRQFASYCGCCPRVLSSAGKVYSARVNRHSNKYLRTLFYQAATVVAYFTKESSALKDYAERVMDQKGRFSSKLALSILAAKINKIAFAILRDDKPFSSKMMNLPSELTAKKKKARFCVVDRSLLRNARNSLQRVAQMEALQKLDARKLEIDKLIADFDAFLQGKN